MGGGDRKVGHRGSPVWLVGATAPRADMAGPVCRIDTPVRCSQVGLLPVRRRRTVRASGGPAAR
ncbi:hypothetical protein DVS28_b0553 (plasmid) [Euzebya pacifica]|uniref:Uncharacterized protein n=1 Tax=Euzebya pacifica TaxID=1608957 RepID=A0A346Y746_9ACTN|nr:hypothetical protein DVS28_b0553 [Euzebya pacifica]